jgi:hypothetical protein
VDATTGAATAFGFLDVTPLTATGGESGGFLLA